MLGPQTRIVTLQNGIDSVDQIQAQVGTTAVRVGVIYVSAVIDLPGVIRSPGGLHVIVADAAGGDPVMAKFFAACGRATALQANPTDDIRSAPYAVAPHVRVCEGGARRRAFLLRQWGRRVCRLRACRWIAPCQA